MGYEKQQIWCERESGFREPRNNSTKTFLEYLPPLKQGFSIGSNKLNRANKGNLKVAN